jgi:hypothetical protein
VHAPGRAGHVLSLIRQARGGSENDPRFGHRMRGSGAYAGMLAHRFALACRRLGLNREELPLDTSGFRRPLCAVARPGPESGAGVPRGRGEQLELLIQGMSE